MLKSISEQARLIPHQTGMHQVLPPRLPACSTAHIRAALPSLPIWKRCHMLPTQSISQAAAVSKRWTCLALQARMLPMHLRWQLMRSRDRLKLHLQLAPGGGLHPLKALPQAPAAAYQISSWCRLPATSPRTAVQQSSSRHSAAFRGRMLASGQAMRRPGKLWRCSRLQAHEVSGCSGSLSLESLLAKKRLSSTHISLGCVLCIVSSFICPRRQGTSTLSCKLY